MPFVLTLSCADRPGIVAAISTRLAEHGCNIIDSAQFGEGRSGQFFMRVSFSAPEGFGRNDAWRTVAPVIERFGMTAEVHEHSQKSRVLILVSKFGHCLNDLLYRHAIGALPIEIRAIVSNHRNFISSPPATTFRSTTLPVTPQTKAAQERRLLEIVGRTKVDLVVLARYMQILSEALCGSSRAGRSISIIRSCRASRAPSPTIRRMSAA